MPAPPAPGSTPATMDDDNTEDTGNTDSGKGDGEGRKPVYMAAGLNRFLHIR